jgi:hypothetical protein
MYIIFLRVVLINTLGISFLFLGAVPQKSETTATLSAFLGSRALAETYTYNYVGRGLQLSNEYPWEFCPSRPNVIGYIIENRQVSGTIWGHS